MSPTPTYAKGAIPETLLWGLYRKKHLTHAIRIEGPFKVETREGAVTCQDGWLAIDSGGWPYPIAAEEFAAIYEPAP